MPGRQRPGETRGSRSRTHQLTDEQRRRLRVALRNLRAYYGSWGKLAEAMQLSVSTLFGVARGTDFGSMKLAVKVAQLAGVPLVTLLDGTIASADRCPECGQLLPERR